LLKAGYVHVVDADLQSYFDTIPHDRLMAQVARKISDGGVLALIEGCLRHGVMKEMEHWRLTAGTPQEAVISPLLANIYLHPLDRLMAESGYRMVRYADDLVILCRTAQEAEAALPRAMAWVADNGLRLHPDKTRIGDCRKPGQGFDFPGYRLEAGRRLVRQKSLRAFKSLPPAKAGDKVRAMTGRSRGEHAADHRRSQPHASRMVRLLQASRAVHSSPSGRLHLTKAAGHPAQAGKAARLRPLSQRSPTLG
jgi:RNA-directed DNA polymerase